LRHRRHLANECDLGAIFFSMSEDDVRYVMRHPLMTVERW
jgi:hypothetical protein